MDMPLIIRPFQPVTDLPGLTELVNITRHSDLSPNQVLSLVNWPGFEITRDRFVAVFGGKLSATGMIYPQSSQRFILSVTTHPENRRKGIGSRLVDRLEVEVTQRGGSQVTCAVSASNAGGRAFAAACGFSPAGEVRFFNTGPELPLPEPEFPEGFTLHSIAELGDVQVFVDACNICYQDMWGHTENLEPLTKERVGEWQRQFPNILRPAGMFVMLSANGRPVGVTRADREGEGEKEVRVIDAPGVAPQFRHFGFQKELVLAAAAWLRENGSGPYQIQTWGDGAEAVDIYERLGFHLDEDTHSIEYVRVLGDDAHI